MEQFLNMLSPLAFEWGKQKRGAIKSLSNKGDCYKDGTDETCTVYALSFIDRKALR